MQNNLDIRKSIIDAKLRYWQVANALGIADNQFSRKLRYELPESDKVKIRQIIADLVGDENSGGG